MNKHIEAILAFSDAIEELQTNRDALIEDASDKSSAEINVAMRAERFGWISRAAYDDIVVESWRKYNADRDAIIEVYRQKVAALAGPLIESIRNTGG